MASVPFKKRKTVAAAVAPTELPQHPPKTKSLKRKKVQQQPAWPNKLVDHDTACYWQKVFGIPPQRFDYPSSREWQEALLLFNHNMHKKLVGEKNFSFKRVGKQFKWNGVTAYCFPGPTRWFCQTCSNTFMYGDNHGNQCSACDGTDVYRYLKLGSGC